MLSKSRGRSPEELDIVSAIWVMANNDENPIITYRSIRHRLQLPEDYDIKTLVRSRGELFRQGVRERILEQWKQDMLNGKRLPSWVREIEDDVVRNHSIELIRSDDVFRSQFRTEANAPKSSLETLDWGLQHIERLRKSQLETRDARNKDIQMVVLIIASVTNTILTILNLYISSVKAP